MNKQFQHISYSLHEKSYEHKHNEEELSRYKNWFSNNTTDVWRHLRMLDFINTFINKYPDAKWLTIGDGRFGTASMYIKNNKGTSLCTDIDTSLLKIAKENNMIEDYSYANAEALPFDDNSFDFSFCKESFHHFPRAYISIYEMLRVSKKAIMIVEPRDWLPSPILRRILQNIKNTIKNSLSIMVPHPDTGNYEPIGNYIFSISEREIQKIALGLNLPAVAFKVFHDIYIPGVEIEKETQNSPLLKKIKRKIFINNLLYKIGLQGKNRIIAIIFKESPTERLDAELRKRNFNVIYLPKNPYI